jgi:hypothetical protein
MAHPAHSWYLGSSVYADDWVCYRFVCIPQLTSFRINVINYYQTIMYKNLGITGKKNLLVTGIYNCVGPLTSEPTE